METRAEIALDPSALDRLRARLADTQLGPRLGDDWEHGVSHAWLTELLADWQRYEPARLQARLDRMEHRRVELDGLSIHLVQTPGVGPNPLPLVLTHGWPGSFLEYAELVPLLADPASHGADSDDAFVVVTPSLPGFGFSDRPPSALSSRQTASLWRRLMNALGHEQFVAHGSDLGAGVTGWLARDHGDAVLGIHLATPGLALPRSVEGSLEEQRFAQEVADWNRHEGGYMHEHSTKPGTLAVALSDSPAGLAAWVGEKLVAWSSVRADGSPALTRERMLDTLTLYWATGTIASSLLPYWAFSRHPEAQPSPGDPRRRRPRSRSSAASGSRFPNHHGSSLNVSTRSPPGASTSAEATSRRSPNPPCSPPNCARRSPRCAVAERVRTRISTRVFRVGCSYGMVSIPEEAVDAQTAMLLADARMYEHKGARRPDAASESQDVLVRALCERNPELGQRRHTIIGERIVSCARSLRDVAPLIRSSHERWDGGRYPDKLAGESIPLGARIIGVCDAYDAMTTTRSYRTAISQADAMAELRRCAWRQFDARVVAAFERAIARTRADPQERVAA